MQQPQQLPLLSTGPQPQDDRTRRGPLDAASEALLARFRAARLRAGADTRSVARDISQLRSLVCTVEMTGGPQSLSALVAQPALIARGLCTPPFVQSRATMRARLLAVQHFIRHTCAMEGRNAAAALAALDGMLPSRPEAGWHTTGVQLAGTTARRRLRAPVLDSTDLARIVAAAGELKRPAQGNRDRALVALLCWTGLRAEEVTHLLWERVVQAVVPPGRVILMTRVQRGESVVDLPIVGMAAEALAGLAATQGRPIGVLSGPIFLAAGSSKRAMSYRASRNVLCTACQVAGFPAVQTSDLRAAFAHWLRQGGAQGSLSDHEIAAVLGLERVSSVDRLLRRHVALDAQRLVRETISR